MTENAADGQEELPRRELRGVRTGLQRAGIHFVRAAYEVVAGVGAFIDELVTAARPEGDEPEDHGLTRIELDD